MKPEKPIGARYAVGDMDIRPWGTYVVQAVGVNAAGEESCEKEIHINAGQALSLQSHDHRRENWRVMGGELTVILDGKRVTLQAGQSIQIPKGSIHCMANLTERTCIVKELQHGICREEDIHRYFDRAGRPTVESGEEKVVMSVALYKQLLDELDK
jgi:mannose-6-phosphate isomerase-like protein (cupin superfamily)